MAGQTTAVPASQAFGPYLMVGRANSWDPTAKMDHSGGDGMSDHELARGSNPEIRSLAKRIIASQREQIKQMRQWYSSW